MNDHRSYICSYIRFAVAKRKPEKNSISLIQYHISFSIAKALWSPGVRKEKPPVRDGGHAMPAIVPREEGKGYLF